jgi:hypothetical protein
MRSLCLVYSGEFSHFPDHHFQRYASQRDRLLGRCLYRRRVGGGDDGIVFRRRRRCLVSTKFPSRSRKVPVWSPVIRWGPGKMSFVVLLESALTFLSLRKSWLLKEEMRTRRLKKYLRMMRWRSLTSGRKYHTMKRTHALNWKVWVLLSHHVRYLYVRQP